jgi:methylphosphotriester-DNA--protein-cysteine methyltransferase
MYSHALRTEEIENLAAEAMYRPGDMAALWGISLRHMERIFSQQFGVTPEIWTRARRIEKAKALIGQGYSTKAVAVDLGFASVSHVCHEFRALCGKPPQSFAPRHVSGPQKSV